jgi:hypothetical protein
MLDTLARVDKSLRITEASMILALVFSLGLLLGCELWIAPINPQALSFDDPASLNPVSLCALIRVPFLPMPSRAPAGTDLIEIVAKEEEEDSPESDAGGTTSIAFFIPLDQPHSSLLSSCRRRETALPHHWPSPQLRC